MDKQNMNDIEQAAKRKDWILPWLVFPVLGSGLLGLVLAMLYAAI